MPAGAPLGNKNNERGKRLRSIIEQRLKEKAALEAIVDKAIEQAIAGDPKARDYISDRIAGKPVSVTELSGPEGTDIGIINRIERIIVDSNKHT